MSDFNSAEFVVGSAKGLRVWRADSLGRLTGWTHRQVWTPGENVAVCRRADDAALRSFQMTLYGESRERTEEIKPCAEVTPSCGCGFWAYHSGTPDFGSDSGIVGICEGYGVTTVGTKGFRASKARILALAFPKSSCGCTHDLPFAQSAGVESTVRHNYPEVPTFDSLDAMLAEFPPDKPELPTPEDPDFWTRPDPAISGTTGRFSWGGMTPNITFNPSSTWPSGTTWNIEPVRRPSRSNRKWW